ncbi:hypothetical protein PAPH110629_21660 [Paenibacillus phoenicis]
MKKKARISILWDRRKSRFFIDLLDYWLVSP